MRRQRRRTMHYNVASLFDSTVLWAFPIRKPSPHVIKRDNLRIDEDGVAVEWMRAELSSIHNEVRTRFQDIIATSLNTRRAIRELVLPRLDALDRRMDAIERKLEQIAERIEQR